jgi:hypothetical protein
MRSDARERASAAGLDGGVDEDRGKATGCAARGPRSSSKLYKMPTAADTVPIAHGANERTP